MTKRKNTDSSNYKYDMYDERRAKRRRNRQVGAVAGAGTAAGGVVQGARAGFSTIAEIEAYLPAMEQALGAEIMGDLLVPAALAGGLGAGAIAAGGALGYLAGEFYNSLGVEEEDHMMDLVEAAGALGFPNKNKMPSTYNQGSFAPPYKVKKQTEDIYTSYGFWKVKEQFGTVNGSESLYIAANGFNLQSFAYVLAMSMLRKLFRKIGKEITDFEAPLTITNLGKAYRFSLKYQWDDGNITQNTYTTVIDETLISLAYNIGIVPEIESYIQGTTQAILSSIDLQIIDNYVTNSEPPIFGELPRHLGTLNLKNEKVHYFMSCSVTVQNRTKGAAESGNNVDVVDSQPLKGYLYYFKKNTPQTKMQNFADGVYSQNWSPFERTNVNGIRLINGNAALGAMKDPPTPHFFSNCSKASYVKLEPGAMKKFYVENTYFKYYADLLRSATRYSGSSTSKRQNIADTMMLGLEEVLNSGSSNKITVQYEGENKTGAYFVTGPLPTIKKLYEQENINALD